MMPNSNSLELREEFWIRNLEAMEKEKWNIQVKGREDYLDLSSEEQ